MSAKNQIKSLIAMLLTLSLTACATCQKHPVACTAVGAVVAGSAVAILGQRSSRNHDARGGYTTQPVDCRQVSCL